MIVSLFARRAASSSELLKRSCASLLGLCVGLMSDDALSDKEILFLKKWLDDNDELANTWPGDVLLSRVNNVLGDRFIEECEREHLTHTLRALIDDTLADDPDLETREEVVALDNPPLIEFENRRFCFIGEFIFGTRAACEEAVEALDATTSSEISEGLNYLVVGTLLKRAGEALADASEIQKAIRLREIHPETKIIDEELWSQFLPRELG